MDFPPVPDWEYQPTENRNRWYMASRRTISIGKITALNHEVLDNTMKRRAPIAKSFVAFGKRQEILGGLRHCLPIEPHYNSAQRLITMCDLKVDLKPNASSATRLQ